MSTELTIHRKQGGGAILPENIDQTWRLATAVQKAGMAPKSLDSAEKIMVAMLHGMELGMTPMASVQSIAVINGIPCVYGDGLLGIVRGSGLLEYIKEWHDEDTAHCEVKRKGEPEPVVRTFSQEDAKRAKLDAKRGPWTDGYAPRMRQMRARSWALRDTFADVLKGMHSAEEVMDRGDITPHVAPEPPAPPAPPMPPEPPAIEDQTPPEFNVPAFMANLEDELCACQDTEALGECWAHSELVMEDHLDRNQREAALDIYRKHEARLSEPASDMKAAASA